MKKEMDLLVDYTEEIVDGRDTKSEGNKWVWKAHRVLWKRRGRVCIRVALEESVGAVRSDSRARSRIEHRVSKIPTTNRSPYREEGCSSVFHERSRHVRAAKPATYTKQAVKVLGFFAHSSPWQRRKVKHRQDERPDGPPLLSLATNKNLELFE